jgi:hypothetical protein
VIATGRAVIAGVAALVSMHMPMGKFLFRGAANIGNLALEIKISSSHRMVEVHLHCIPFD